MRRLANLVVLGCAFAVTVLAVAMTAPPVPEWTLIAPLARQEP